MISLAHENVVPLSRARKFLPPRPSGKWVAPSTLFRWASKGLRGQHLEVIRIGATTYTSKEAVQRFCEALTRQESPTVAQRSTEDFATFDSKKARTRLLKVEQAEEELAEAGI